MREKKGLHRYRNVKCFVALTIAAAVVSFWPGGTGSLTCLTDRNSCDGVLGTHFSSIMTTTTTTARVSRQNASQLSECGGVPNDRANVNVNNETTGGTPSVSASLGEDGILTIPTLASWQQQQQRQAKQRIAQAYMTLISSPEYDIGAQLLVCRLRQYSPNTTILVVVDESILPLRSVHYYQRMGVDLIQVSNPGKEFSNTSVSSELRIGTYTKLQLWNLTMVDVAVYMDADALPIQNPQDLFHELTLQQDFGAVGHSKYMNTGIMVFRPNYTTYSQLMERLRTNDYAKAQNDPTEQDLLVSHFGDSRPETKFIDAKYNYRPLHHPLRLMDYAVVVHYIGNPKPWTAIFGQETTIQGYAPLEKDHLPTWSMQSYQCEMERFFTECHAPTTAVHGSELAAAAMSRCWSFNATVRRRQRRRLRLATGFET